MKLSYSLVALSLIVSACGSSKEDRATTGASELKFRTSSYTLKPGEEKYYCYTMNLPSDRETLVTELTPTYGKATHHFGMYSTIAAEPEGFSECPVLVRETWIPLYGGGVDSGPLKLPAGAGFRLGKGQQILIQLHLLNASKAEVTDTATMTMKTADPAVKVTTAGMFGFDNRDLNIPAKTMDVEQVMSCDVPFDMNVFGVFGHMHKQGKSIELSRGATPGAEILYSTAWNFDQQPTVLKSISIKKGDKVHIRCKWDNATDSPIKYGESTLDEMCSFVWYYTPYEHLDGCLKNPK